MTLLDRFRTPDRHKHPDPTVRLAYVEEIPLEARDLIAAIAREDEDERVRRAAIAKLMDPATLGRSHARTSGRKPSGRRRRRCSGDIALEVFEGVTEGDSLEAVDALTDPRVLAQVAKAAVREIVALRALSRIADSRMLGSVARHAASEAARLGAFERVADETQERLAVAMNSEYKDTAAPAVEMITERAELEQVASRGKNKSAAKRARGIIREADERAAREAAAAGTGSGPQVAGGFPSGPSPEERATAEAKRAEEEQRRAEEAHARTARAGTDRRTQARRSRRTHQAAIRTRARAFDASSRTWPPALRLIPIWWRRGSA